VTELDRLRAALRWYATEAKAIKTHAASPTGTTALMATIQVLASDGGRRAEEALAERETEKE
jgi:hypothetical protein